jgi:rRNA maturation RNase YbeY
MIEINNLTNKEIKEEFLKRLAEKVLKEEKKEGNLSIALIGPNRMRKLNKKYRGKNRVTDVLAFAGNEAIPIPSGQKADLGEIVICLREVKKNAKRFGQTFEKELARCLIHGILHLFDFDHEKSEREAERMRERENYYLNLFFK